jgi:hypothetical protein
MMLDQLLENKKKCLLRFLEKSKNFLQESASGDFTHLSEFYNHREMSLEVIKRYDRKIEYLKSQKNTISKAFQIFFQDILQSIQKVDEAIFQQIELEKNRLIQHLNITTSQKNLVKKFKSSWISESGISLDGKL